MKVLRFVIWTHWRLGYKKRNVRIMLLSEDLALSGNKQKKKKDCSSYVVLSTFDTPRRMWWHDSSR